MESNERESVVAGVKWMALVGLLCLGAWVAHAAVASTVTAGTWCAKTYPFGDPDPVPALGSDRYPYFRYDGSTDTPVTQNWQTVTLENSAIRVVLLPQIGGKIWSATDKKTGVDFIYRNNVVKFRDIAMRGPWCSGGIEFNFGIIGHAPSSATPVDWCTRTNDDGSVSCFVASAEYITRSWWQVEVRLRPDAEEFETQTTWYNASGLMQPYYHWMNAAYSVRGNPQFLFPGAHYVGHEGDAHAWPRDAAGHALDVYEGNAFGGPKSYHVLPGENDHYGIWWPQKNVGSYHRSLSYEKYGRKIWLWALSREGGIWEDLLTDDDGQYTELQSGRYYLQPRWGNYATPFKYPAFSPGATETFAETWGVLRDKKAFLIMHEESVESRPLVAPSDFDWQSAYGRYVRGRQHILERHDAEAEECFRQALVRERHFVPAWVALAAIELRRGSYADCHAACAQALAVDTTDEGANYLDGFAYFAERKYRAARDRLGVAAFGTRYRSAALALIARSYLAEGNRVAASEAARKALCFNAANLDALTVELIALRGTPQHVQRVRALLRDYPLYPAFRYEEDPTRFAMCVCNELAPETYRELGYWYAESGFAEDAARLRAYAQSAKGASLPPFRREQRAELERTAHSGDWRAHYELGVLLASFNLNREADAQFNACGTTPDDATFYLVRSARRTGAARLADLRRAAEKGDSWRVGRALCAYYEDAHDEARFLETATAYRTRYPDKNPIQIAYARALLANGKYQAVLDYLKDVKILPSEHRDSATDVWHAAQKALGLQLTYPENLGKGKPYD